jgi:hypothetical protein
MQSKSFFDLSPYLRGVISAFDLFGVLPTRREQILARSDAEALAGDWQAVGMDLYHAMKSFDPEKDWRAPKVDGNKRSA